MPTLSIAIPDSTKATVIDSPPSDALKWTHEARNEAAARDLVARGGVCPQAAAAVVTLARNASGTGAEDGAALLALLPTLLTTQLTEGERCLSAIESVELTQWDVLARAADWSQQFITAFYRVRQAREEAARAVKRKREAVAEAETEAELAARAERSAARMAAEAEAPEAFVAYALKARPEGEALPTLELSYKRFTQFNRSDTAERIEEAAFVAQVPLLIDDFRAYCAERYPELSAISNSHHRKAEIFKLWRERQDALMRWCEARGRIATYAEFQTLHKERCAKRKLRLHDAWSDYTKTWDRIAGMALSARRRTEEVKPPAPKKAPAQKNSSEDDDEEDADASSHEAKKKKTSDEEEPSRKAKKAKKAAPPKKAESEDEDDDDDDDDDDELEMPRRIGAKGA